MTNWLTFTQSRMEMVRSSDQESQFVSYDNSSSTSPYLLDNFYGWSNQKPHGFFKEEEEAHIVATSMADSTFVDTQLHVPKLEDFLGDFSSPFVRYSADNTQAETQEDSSLTQIYDPRHHHHHNNQTGFYSDLTMTGFQTGFSTKSGSDVDVAESYPVLPELGFINGGCVVKGGALSLLGVNINDTNHITDYNHITNHHYNDNREEKTESEKEKLFAIVEKSDCSKKKVANKLGTGQRTSIYRGVTRHRWTGRYEAHLWDNSCKREGQARKGRQVYLGGYDKEDKAARAYDLAALKYWNADATTNFPITNYAKELEEMKHMTKQEFIASLRRRSSGFSRGASIYRGVTRHHQQGRWQARIGRVSGNKDLYLGTFTTEEEAAEAYDIAAIKFRGTNAVTNFEMNRYDVETIMKTTLPIGGAAKRLRLSMEASPTEEKPILSFQQLLQLQIQSCPNQSSIKFGLCPNSDVQSHIVPFEAASLFHHQQQQNFLHYFPENVASDSTGSNDGSNGQGSMGVLAPNPAEFFLWPNQSY